MKQGKIENLYEAEIQAICEVFAGNSDLDEYGGGCKNAIAQKASIALKKLDSPQIGDRCAFWDNDKSKYVVGYLQKICIGEEHEFLMVYSFLGVDYLGYDEAYKNCAKIKQEAEF